MMQLEQASRDIQLWTTLQVIDGYINTKQTKRLRSIYDVLKVLIDEYTKGEKEFTVEDFVNYSDKDLERAGFRRHGKPNDKGEVLYLIPLVLYPIMPQELIVFGIDDNEFAYPKTMKELLKSMVGKHVTPSVSHGVLLQSVYWSDETHIDHSLLKFMFDSANIHYEPGAKTKLKVTYCNGLVTISVVGISVISEKQDGHRFSVTREIDVRGQKSDLASFIYIMDSVKAFLDGIRDVSIDYDDFDTWKMNYLKVVQSYLQR